MFVLFLQENKGLNLEKKFWKFLFYQLNYFPYGNLFYKFLSISINHSIFTGHFSIKIYKLIKEVLINFFILIKNFDMFINIKHCNLSINLAKI